MARFTFSKDDQGYALKDELSKQHPLRIDFTSSKLNYRRLKGGKKELLFKAVNTKSKPHVWDCTGGLGNDSFLLAAQGCRVTLFERSVVLAFLLEQAMKTAACDDETKDIIARMNLVKKDAVTALSALTESDSKPDVILIDPMFPDKRKNAQVKGEMQILQRFIGKDEDVLDLVQAALNAKCPRVVIKRPANGGEIEGFKPNLSFAAKSSRFDIFLS